MASAHKARISKLKVRIANIRAKIASLEAEVEAMVEELDDIPSCAPSAEPETKISLIVKLDLPDGTVGKPVPLQRWIAKLKPPKVSTEQMPTAEPQVPNDHDALPASVTTMSRFATEYDGEGGYFFITDDSESDDERTDPRPKAKKV